MIDAAQRRLYRRALDLAPPGVARIKGLEIVDNKELQDLVNVKTWSHRVKFARVRLLTEARYARGEPIHTAVFDGQGLPRLLECGQVVKYREKHKHAVPGCKPPNATRQK